MSLDLFPLFKTLEFFTFNNERCYPQGDALDLVPDGSTEHPSHKLERMSWTSSSISSILIE
jgi:hypothetical protein